MILLIITAISAVAMQFVVCFRLREDASELTSAFVILYVLYLQWSALSSRPDAECNPYEDSQGNSVFVAP